MHTVVFWTSFFRSTSAIVLTVAVWMIVGSCADQAAWCFIRVQIRPSWLTVVAPLASIVVINPWYWIKHKTFSPFHILCGWKRYLAALLVVVFMWILLACEIRRKVVSVEFLPELDEAESVCLYKSLGKHWSYDAKRSRTGDVSGQTDKWSFTNRRH